MNFSITNKPILPQPRATVRFIPSSATKLAAWRFRVRSTAGNARGLVLNGALDYAEAVAIAENHFRKEFGDLEFIDL